MLYAQQSMMTISEARTEQPSPDWDYLLLRLQWRKSLSDVDVRALAYEYRISLGQKPNKRTEPVKDCGDTCLNDAWEEYIERFGGTPHTEFVKKASSLKSRRRRPKYR